MAIKLREQCIISKESTETTPRQISYFKKIKMAYKYNIDYIGALTSLADFFLDWKCPVYKKINDFYNYTTKCFVKIS